MVGQITEQMVIFPFEFIAPTEVEIEETSKGVAIIKGIMLREGVSTNGNVYTVDEMENIAKQAENMPIYVGTRSKIDPNLGIKRDNMHDNTESHCVGRIISAIFDKAKRVIRYIAEIVNTSRFPKIIEEVKAGWGISIGGKADAKVVIDKARRILYKITNMILSHIQLLEPHVKLGQDEARVQNVEIQETMIMYELIKKEKINVSVNVVTDGFCGLEIS